MTFKKVHYKKIIFCKDKKLFFCIFLTNPDHFILDNP